MTSSYRTLDGDMYQIRMLTHYFRPTDATNLVIICTINPIKFNVLSYCWADPNVTKFVFAKDTKTSITINLTDVLPHLRTHSISKAWANALCDQRIGKRRICRLAIRSNTIKNQYDLLEGWYARVLQY